MGRFTEEIRMIALKMAKILNFLIFEKKKKKLQGFSKFPIEIFWNLEARNITKIF